MLKRWLVTFQLKNYLFGPEKPTVGREGHSEAASAAAGAAGKSSENSLQKWKQSDIFDGDFYWKGKNGEILKLKSRKKMKINHVKGSDTDF